MGWRWPWAPAEDREAEGGYTGIISQLVELQAAGTTQQASATAAMEAAAGALSRAFMGAAVEGPPDVAAVVSPRALGQIGRDLVRVGESLHVIRMGGRGLRLLPASTWYWEGGADPADWTCTATTYGPSASETYRVPFDSVLFVAWGSPTARPYHGLGPGSWARDTARLMSNAERSLANEAGGPVAQLLPIPQDGGDGAEGEDADALAGLKADCRIREGKRAARGNDLGRMGRGCRERAAERLEGDAARAATPRGVRQGRGRFVLPVSRRGWRASRAVRRGRGRNRDARELAAMAHGGGAPARGATRNRTHGEIRDARLAQIRRLPDGHGFPLPSVREARRG